MTKRANPSASMDPKSSGARKKKEKLKKKQEQA
jgi:hypothetical protein